MPYTPINWQNGAGGGTPLSAANLDNMEDAIVALDAAVFADPVTSLPGSPTDKQRALYVDSLTAPTYAWLFQYESGISDSNKWICVGGSAKVGATGISVPLAGVYDVHGGAHITDTGGVSTTDATATLAASAGSLTGKTSSQLYFQAGAGLSGVTVEGDAVFLARWTGATAAATLSITSGDGTVSDTYLFVRPLRVA